MAGSYNRIILVGNLTRDPEIRYVQSGSAVTKFAIAVNRRTKGGDETTFVDIVAWDSGNYKLAETCNTYLKKGMSVLVEGRLVIRSYEDKDGNKRKATEVVIDNMQMLDSKGGGGGASRANGDGGSYDNVRPMSKTPSSHSSLDEEALDDEIPF
ncbi:MAG: single-stranded DNA-binding protein [Candidatus Velthaea sp.]|jgi:single-strand DNA-binding protein